MFDWICGGYTLQRYTAVHVHLFMQTNLHGKPCVHTYLLRHQFDCAFAKQRSTLRARETEEKCHRPLFFFGASSVCAGAPSNEKFRRTARTRNEERHVNGEWQQATHNIILRNVRATNCDRTGRNKMKIANDAARCQHFPFFLFRGKGKTI